MNNVQAAPPETVLVILNPASGQGDPVATREAVEAFLGARGLEYQVRETEAQGDARRWAKETEAELVIASGGDGTIMEAMNGVIENPRRPLLAQLPLGTANLLARALGVPGELGAALELALEGAVAELDVGYLAEHDLYFALVAGAGWDAQLIEGATREIKDRLGFLAYIVSGVKTLFALRPSRITLEIDGRERRVRAHTVMIINVGEMLGSGITLGADITPHDGKLDVAIVTPTGVLGLVRLALKLLFKRFENGRELSYLSAERIRVSASPPLKLEVDGEAIGTTPFAAEVRPKAVRLVVPAEYIEVKRLPRLARRQREAA